MQFAEELKVQGLKEQDKTIEGLGERKEFSRNNSSRSPRARSVQPEDSKTKGQPKLLNQKS